MLELLARGSSRRGSYGAFVPSSQYRFTGLRKTLVFFLILFACAIPQVAFATITVDQFVANTMGRELSNAAGTYPGECVSLVSQYLLQVYGVNNTGWNANAIDYQAGGNGGNQLAAHGFNWSTDQNFANGDILVWGPNAAAGTSSYGHVGIWYGGKVYDQNDGRHSPATVAGYSTFWTGGYLGHWRNGTPSSSLTASTPKAAFNTGEHVVVNWTAYPGATKYGLTVWKAPYTGDANIVWDNYVTGTSMDIGALPLDSYRIHMAAYVGTTLVVLSNYCDFSVVNPPDTTAPTTHSDAAAMYVGSATIHLTAADNTGGCGLAHTYFKLDGGSQTEGLVVTTSIPGSHTVTFWSVDALGNTEKQQTLSFTVAPTPGKSLSALKLTITSDRATSTHGHAVKFSGITSPSVPNGTKLSFQIRKLGTATWTTLSVRSTFSSHHWSYTLSTKNRKHGAYFIRVHYAGTAYMGADSSSKKLSIK
jgi:hypothetical protein